MTIHLRSYCGVLLAVCWCVFILPALPLLAQSPPPDEGWPRVHELEDGKVIAYQPQVDSWQDYKHLQARMAIQVIPKGKTTGDYGAVQLEMDTETNFQSRMVLLKNVTIKDLRFPGTPGDEAEAARRIYTGFLSQQPAIMISLDRVIAAVKQSQEQRKTVEVNLAPPQIFYSDKPAILVILIGEPRLETAGEGLLFAANTNWDLFLDSTQGNYFLRNDTSWLTTKDVLQGPWSPAKQLPDSLSKLPDDENWKDVKNNIPGYPATVAPAVYVCEEPSELIVTRGRPTYKTVPGTDLLYVDNTESDLFLNPTEGKHYFTVAGRWFRAKDLWGPWQEASQDLPEEFKKIPETSEKASVLASVPGAPDAEAAVLLASIPQKATVDRKNTTIQVVYEGEPKFKPIETTTLFYAVNTPDSVIQAGDAYYCCRGGIWFVAPSPKGEWAVADSVPEQIYSIPPENPMHNTSYVYVYDSNPETVEVGYTSGYTGAYVAATGVLMFGLGYWAANEINDDHWHDYYYHYGPPYWGYGCAAHYDYYNGGYVRAASYYGPYGGAGRAASYNPATGTYRRAAYAYGPHGSAYARGAYNPYTGGYAGHAQANTPYGSWGRTVIGQGDQWVQAGHRSNAAGATGGIRTSEGTGIVAHKNKITGDTGGAAKDKYGDVYVGHDGNIYKRDSSGDWSKYDGDQGWVTPEPKSKERVGKRDSAVAPDSRAATARRNTAGENKPAVDMSNRPQTPGIGPPPVPGGRPNTMNPPRQPVAQRPPASMSVSPGLQQLNQDYQARQRGEMNARGYENVSKRASGAGAGDPNYGSSPRRGGGNLGAARSSGGGGGRHGGGRRR